MAEKTADSASEKSLEEALDLNTLSEFDFGPSWASKKTVRGAPKPSSQATKSKRDYKNRGEPRKQFGLQDKHRSRKEEYRSKGPGQRSQQRKEFTDFQPPVKVDIYPQDEAFDALVSLLRSTLRTYQLFEIAHLILEKPERYQVVVQHKAKEDETPAPLYFSVPHRLPFETEGEAIDYVLENHLDLFFDVEKVDVEPPKGNFQLVYRCTVTGAFIGPPNYHRYQEFLQQHYAEKINTMSFETFTSKLEPVKDQESIDAWLESMKMETRYLLKERREGEPESFDSINEVRAFLVKNRKDSIVSSQEIVRFAGSDIKCLPKGAIRRSVEMYIENQFKFPLDTANNIRGRLRRHNFAVYKRGAKGISYVCAVKRKFRYSDTSFSASIQSLIEFIEKHPNIPAVELPARYIGIDMEKQKSTGLEVANAEVATAKTDSDDQASEPPTAETPDAAASENASSQATLSKDDQEQLKQLISDLRWLISEGYVTEYGDRRLFVAPIVPESKTKDFSKQPGKGTVPEEIIKKAETPVKSDSPIDEGTEKALATTEVSPAPDEPKDVD